MMRADLSPKRNMAFATNEINVLANVFCEVESSLKTDPTLGKDPP
jgi:hypothetical protein